MHWHTKDIETVIRSLKSGPEGLDTRTAAERLVVYGSNEIEEEKKKPAWLLFLGQFKDFMILALIAAAIIAGFLADITDTIIILTIVIINAVVGFIQEYKAGKAIEALKKISALQAQVVRDGNVLLVRASQLVPGDLVLLEQGNVIPADLRLTEVINLRVDESALTGESEPVEKTNRPLSEENLPTGDRLNLAYKSTVVTQGRGRGIVVATGMKTEIGMIAGMLQQPETVTPLQRRMTEFGKKLSYIILMICTMLFVIGLLRGEAPLRMLLLSVSLAVAAIPEALPALITMTLSRGAKKLVKKSALIRKLPAVETLGSVTYICSDKTGTLTQNRMKVTRIYDPDPENTWWNGLSLFQCAVGLNHDVNTSAENHLLGDPTEVALAEYFINQNDENISRRLRKELPRVAELPFDSDRRCMTTVHRYRDRYLVISKGAAESIAAVIDPGKANKHGLNLAWQMSSEGMRVIAYATKVLDKLPEPFSFEKVEQDLIFTGLTGMIDPPREEVKKAIDACRSAGISPVMITGDHPGTAATIAKEIGLLTENDQVVTGMELHEMTTDQLVERVEKIRLYARVSPAQKLKIINALKRKGHIVAMTGDGVNDAPALKSADIGVAMGINGTDVSKEAADMILLDDNFATIVKAVREGRRIYDNIRRFIKYIMTCNGAEIWTLFLAPLIGLPVPLLPVHILWINLITDGLPGLALSGEKAERDIMDRAPRKPDESLFAKGIGFHIVWVGLVMAGITLGAQAWAVSTGREHWQTIVFTVLSLSQLGHVMAIRSEEEFIYKHGFISNYFLVGAVLLTFLLQLGVIYHPVANELLKTQPLSLLELGICVGLSALVFHVVELEKYIKRIYFRKQRKNHG